MTFSEVLRAHAARYPEMREGDFLKLCYQHALGCGHLVKDEAEAVRLIRAERAPGEEGVSFEPIGNGLVRMHLKGMDARFSDEIAARMFTYTAETFHPAPDALESALQTLAETFPTDAMRAAIAAYRAEGCPMVSHTEAYRRAYAPAYRVVSERFARYAALFEAAARLPEGAIFALDGMCASGKTSLSNALGFVFRAPVFHMDDFFLPAEKRTKERLSEVGGNVDRERFREEVLAPLAAGRTVSYRRFDCGTMTILPPVEIKPGRLNIVEGAYACHPELRGYYARTACLTVPPEEQLRRIRARDGEEMLERFRTMWIESANRRISYIERRKANAPDAFAFCMLWFRSSTKECPDRPTARSSEWERAFCRAAVYKSAGCRSAARR